MRCILNLLQISLNLYNKITMNIINNHDFNIYEINMTYLTYSSKINFQYCGQFENIWKFFPDDLDESGNYKFTSILFKKYCSNNNCNSDISKIDAGCLWLFNKYYGSLTNFSSIAHNNINIVLNQKLNAKFSNLNDFYSSHMQNVNEYKQPIDDVNDYSSYNDLINKKKELMNISNENMSKLYDLFKILCNMVNNADKKDDGETCLKYANNFVNKHNELKNNSNNIKDDSYNKILSILSDSYTSFKNSYYNSNIRNKLPSLITKETTTHVSTIPKETQDLSSEIPAPSSEIEISDSDSGSPSSSILNRLISIPFIFFVALILLGIAYKVNNNSIKKIYSALSNL
ncbi:hypothetical protein YYC_04303 [Plasmodium yoelii 17X]|uniref:Uncharacterized protein n=1 Tax=Plasmodium yoelii 17X TaxID=1323249 RepID=V7PGC9_PLAYE|nr:hypothetical protein YYC_04303 [Plasmodium yoelii 17X]